MKENVGKPSTPQPQSLILNTVRQVLKPLIRLLLAHGITYTLLLDELKRLFVEIADKEFQIGNKPQTDSRITLLTGVHRRDVHRFRNETPANTIVRTNFGAQLMAQWLGNPRFIDSNKKPRKLPRFSTFGEDESFESLVASVSKDIRARPVLDEWLRTGKVTMLDDGDIELNTDAFIPKEDLEQKLFFFGMNIHDHLASAVNNLQDGNKSMVERCTYHDGLTIDQVEEIHQLIKVKGMDYLKEVNLAAINQNVSNANHEAAQFRINSGIYFYYEPLIKVDADKGDND